VNLTHQRPPHDFFLRPANPNQRRYEALRAHFVEGLPLRQAAARLGYTPAAFASLLRDFRAGRLHLFSVPQPGPKLARRKEAARPQVVKLRRQGLSVYEIAKALQDSPTPLNRTGVTEILHEEGFARFHPRPYAARGGPSLEPLQRARKIDFDHFPRQFRTEAAGAFLAIPELLALDLPALVQNAGYPGTRDIPALSSILSLLALKLVAIRRAGNVKNVAHDPAMGLFAGLASIPKTTALTTYSYRCEHTLQTRFLSALGQAMRRSGLSVGEEFDLDFHAIMHYGNDPVLEEHYVPRRSQRTASILTFFAQDSGTHNIVYANADLLKADQNQEVIAFCDHWCQVHGEDPKLLVFDSTLTTHAVLSQLNQRGVRFLTLRARRPPMLKQLAQLPSSAWQPVQLERAGGYRRVRVHDDHHVRLHDYDGEVRQLAVRGLGHEEPTLVITNDLASRPKLLIEKYSHRMGIEQRLAEWIRAFHIDALSSAVPLNVDLDVVISVLASAICDSLRQRLRGYATATPDTLQQRFLSTAGDVAVHDDEVIVTLARRSFSPVLRQAAIPSVRVPWWGGRRLVFRYS
jgi:Transposase DDE domain group 1